jgi:hypothetical protein
MAVLDEVEGMMTCGRLNIYGTCQSIEWPKSTKAGKIGSIQSKSTIYEINLPYVRLDLLPCIHILILKMWINQKRPNSSLWPKIYDRIFFFICVLYPWWRWWFVLGLGMKYPSSARLAVVITCASKLFCWIYLLLLIHNKFRSFTSNLLTLNFELKLDLAWEGV